MYKDRQLYLFEEWDWETLRTRQPFKAEQDDEYWNGILRLDAGGECRLAFIPPNGGVKAHMPAWSSRTTVSWSWFSGRSGTLFRNAPANCYHGVLGPLPGVWAAPWSSFALSVPSLALPMIQYSGNISVRIED